MSSTLPGRPGRLLRVALLAIAAAAAGVPGPLRAQPATVVSVPFTNGFIGQRGSSAGTANGVLTYATLGIARTFFIQNSSTNAFEIQGNDIPGTLRIVRTNGTILDIPASANWRNSGGTTYLIGILPRPLAPVTLAYAGGSIQITDGSNPGGSSVGGYVAGYGGAMHVDGDDTNGNAAQSQVLGGLNSYYAAVVAARPAGPVTVQTQTTASTTPTITGSATLAAGEQLSVTVGGAEYTATSTPAVVRSGTTWSLTLSTPLAAGTYGVTATITNASGYTLSDATSDELVIASGGTLTLGGAPSATSKVYDGTVSASGSATGLTLVGVTAGHQVSIAAVTLAFQTAAVGSGKTVVITGVTLAGTHAALYTVSLAGAPTATAAITARPLTIAGVSAASRVYDGTTAIALTGTPSYVGLATGESFAVAGTPAASVASAAVGTGKAVAVTGYAAPSANYAVTQPTGLTASITPRPLSIGGAFTAADKPYDGTTAATIATNALTLAPVVAGDLVALTGVTAAFASPTVGTGKPVTLTGATLTGAAAGNYTLSLAGAPATTASILSAGGTVTLGGTFTAADKVYDGTVAATGNTSALTLIGVAGQDQVSIAAVTLAFQTPAVGAAKTVVVTGVTLAGADAGRYAVSLAGAPTASAAITPRALTLAGTFVAADKVFDGTATATITASALSLVGVVGADQVTLQAPAAAFASAAVGAGKVVALTGATLAGTAAANYTLSLAGAPTTTAAITSAGGTLTLTGAFTASDKGYDGTVAASGSTAGLALAGVAAGDQVAIASVTLAFQSPTAGSGKPVVVAAVTLAGADAARYAVSLAGAPTSTAAITPRPLTVGGSFTVASRPYDGTTAAAITGSALTLVGAVAGDAVALAAPTAAFATASVGASKPVTLVAATLAGAAAGNYTLSLAGAPTTTADITSAGGTLTLTGSVTADDKVYDGTVVASGSAVGLALAGLVAGDQVSIAGVTLAFQTAAAGAAKRVAITAVTLAGADAARYAVSLAGAPSATATITPRPLSIGGAFTAADKPYDGTAAATIATSALTLAPVVAGDVVALTGVTAAFASPTVGTAKPVTLTGATLTGAAAGNYTLSLVGAPATTAAITSVGGTVTLTGAFTAADKVYDRGTLASGVTGGLGLAGVVAGDEVRIAAVTLAFQTPTVGLMKPVVVTGVTLAGADAGRYAVSLAGAPTSTAAITARALTIGGSFTVADKVFDGGTVATIATSALRLDGVLAPDQVTLEASSARFADPAVGTGKRVVLDAVRLAGSAAGNYALVLASAPAATASILPAAPPGAPRQVRATAGDRTVTVEWTAPATPGCRAVSGYVVEHRADDVERWERAAAAAGATSHVLGGLSNNVPHFVRVAAVNACGTGEFAAAPERVVPVAPARTAAGELLPSAPGTATASTGGTSRPATLAIVEDTIAELRDGELALRLRTSDRPGAPLPIDSTRTVQLEHGGRALVEGRGFAPGTVVSTFLFDRRSAPVLLGLAPVAGDGTVAATLPIPPTLAVGSHTLQVNGVDRGAAHRSLALGVEVAAEPPDLELTATPDQSTPAVGDTVVITLTVTNHGRGPAVDVVIPRAFREPGFVVVRTAPREGSYRAETQEWLIPHLAPGAAARLVLTAVVVPPPTPLSSQP